MMREVFADHQGISVKFVDLTDLENLRANLRPETKVLPPSPCNFAFQLIWLETPSNPLLKVIDIAGVVEIAKAYKRDILISVDNTFMSPFFQVLIGFKLKKRLQHPLALGADIVVHSVTKYINGHSDVLMGAAATNVKAIDDHLYHQQRGWEKIYGRHFSFSSSSDRSPAIAVRLLPGESGNEDPSPENGSTLQERARRGAVSRSQSEDRKGMCFTDAF